MKIKANAFQQDKAQKVYQKETVKRGYKPFDDVFREMNHNMGKTNEEIKLEKFQQNKNINTINKNLGEI